MQWNWTIGGLANRPWHLAKPRTKYETQESKHNSLFAKQVVMWCYYYYIKKYDPHNEVAYEKINQGKLRT